MNEKQCIICQKIIDEFDDEFDDYLTIMEVHLCWRCVGMVAISYNDAQAHEKDSG